MQFKIFPSIHSLRLKIKQLTSRNLKRNIFRDRLELTDPTWNFHWVFVCKKCIVMICSWSIKIQAVVEVSINFQQTKNWKKKTWSNYIISIVTLWLSYWKTKKQKTIDRKQTVHIYLSDMYLNYCLIPFLQNLHNSDQDDFAEHFADDTKKVDTTPIFVVWHVACFGNFDNHQFFDFQNLVFLSIFVCVTFKMT